MHQRLESGIIYSKDSEADSAFFRDVLKFDSVDVVFQPKHPSPPSVSTPSSSMV